ncbi:MAG: HDOD domain-containing protein, partial [Planctomycetes bacterium]|nr:HDOD domain-containing protein [Planctomycetota bacterium]
MAFPINALVQETTHFKPLPQAALRLVGILGREDWAPEEVIDVVKHDPVLTGRVLGAANSATFSGKAKILSLEEA